MEPLETTDVLEPPECPDPMPPTTTLSLVLRTSASNALLDPPESPETPDPRDSLELLEPLERLDPTDAPELLEPLDLRDPLASLETTDSLDSLELPDRSELCPLLLVLLDSPESLDLRDLLEPMDTPDNPDRLDLLDPRESLDRMEPPETLEPLENLELLERTDPREDATTALLLVPPPDIKSNSPQTWVFPSENLRPPIFIFYSSNICAECLYNKFLSSKVRFDRKIGVDMFSCRR